MRNLLRWFAHRQHITIVGLIVLIVSIGIPLVRDDAQAQSSPRVQIESDSPSISRFGNWSLQQAVGASGGSYLYSSGSEADVLTIEFNGPMLEVVYAVGPSLGTLAIEVDGTVLRTVITHAETVQYQMRASVNYLESGTHNARIYAQEGDVIGVDAFAFEDQSTGTIAAAPCNINEPVIHRVSLASDHTQSNGGSSASVLSRDGHYAAFVSNATNLVPNDTNGVADIFVYDRQTCDVERISVSSGGTQGNQASSTPKISDDGRYVVFVSASSNLHPSDTDTNPDIYLHDRQTHQTSLLTQMGWSVEFLAFSGNGQYIVFRNSNGSHTQIYRMDVQTGQQVMVSSTPEGGSGYGNSLFADISYDGRYVAFDTGAGFTAPDSNLRADIYVRDLTANTITLASISFNGTASNNDSYYPRISTDGRYVAFQSMATNLVEGDSNGVNDIFVRDLQAGQTIRASVSSTGVQPNNISWIGDISGDGRNVVFLSSATNLVTQDTNGTYDAFLHDTQTGITSLLTVNADGGQANNGNEAPIPSISTSGSYVTFGTTATNLVPEDTNGVSDIFVIATGNLATPTNLVATPLSQTQINLTWTDNSDETEFRVERRLFGSTLWAVIGTTPTNIANYADNGVSCFTYEYRVQAYQSTASLYSRYSNVVLATPLNCSLDAPDLQASAPNYHTVNLSWTDNATTETQYIVEISPNGTSDWQEVNTLTVNITSMTHTQRFCATTYFYRVRAYRSSDNTYSDYSNVANATTQNCPFNGECHQNGMFDRPAWTTQTADDGAISRTGRYVVFSAEGLNVAPGDTTTTSDIFLTDMETCQILLVSVNSNNETGNAYSGLGLSVTPDGRYVTFRSLANNFTPNDTITYTDIFVRDMFTGQIIRASGGSSGIPSNEDSYGATISDDGRYVAFLSEAGNLVPNDSNNAIDAFLYDRQTDTLTRISVTENGSQSSAQTNYVVISGNGRYIAFDNRAPLVAPDDANSSDLFVYDLQTGVLNRETSAYDGSSVNGSLAVNTISYDGRYVGFISTATNLVPEDSDSAPDVLLLDRQNDALTLLSVGTDGSPSNTTSGNYLLPWGFVSDDGRFATFISGASNLVPDDTNQCGIYNPVPCPDVFLRDLQTSTTLRISVTETWDQASGYSSGGQMSGDGRFILVSAEDALTSNGNYGLYLFKNDFVSPSLPPLRTYEVTSTQISILWQDFRTDETEFRVERSSDGLTGWVEIGAAPANQTYFIDNNRPCGVDFYYRIRAYRSSDGAFSPYTDHVQARTTCIGTCDTQAITMRVSTQSPNTGADALSPGISTDGRYVTFVSLDDHDVFGQDNGVADVYIQDRQTCTIEIVSIATSGDRGNGHSSYINYNGPFYSPAVSDDGRYVVFSSSASNLVIGDFNGEQDIFLRDRLLQQTLMISTLPDGTEGNDSSGPAVDMTPDGRYIVFATAATNLAPGLDYAQDIMRYDRQTGTLERITEGLGGIPYNSSAVNPQISADGNYIVFLSYASNIVPNDTNNGLDVFLYDRQNDVTSRINLDPNGQQVAAYSGDLFIPALSANGQYIAFAYQDAGLVADDTNGYQDIFLYHHNTHAISIASHTSIGFEANNASSNPSISGDGRYITFSSLASNLSSNDINNSRDIFVYDHLTNVVYRVSMTTSGTTPNSVSRNSVIAGAGGFVAFDSLASNLVAGDTNYSYDVYVVNLAEIEPPIDLLANPVSRTQIDLQWSNPFITETAYILERRGGNQSSWVEVATLDFDQTFYSDTGLLCDTMYEYRVRARFTLTEFSTYSSSAYPSTDHCAVTCRPTDAVHRISIGSDGTQGDQLSSISSLSADGRYVLFVSTATNLVSDVQGLSPSNRQLYLHDRQTCITILISRAPDGTAGNDYTAQQATISDNGRYVAFTSASSNLVPDDTNGVSDTFLFDTQSNSMTRISVAADGTQQNDGGSGVDISADGRFVVFASYASNLVSNDNSSISDIFLYDRLTHGISRLSNGYTGSVGNGSSSSPRISPDGRYVVFGSRATNLLNIPSDPSFPRERVYQRDLQTNQLTLVSVQVSGTYTTADSFTPDLSNDGRYVVYSSYATNLVANDTNGTADVFLWDHQTNATTRVSMTNTGSQINGDSLNPTISGDGRFIVFSNSSSSIDFPDGNGAQDVFIYDRQSNRLFLISTSNGMSAANGASQYPMISNNGSLIAFESLATSFITGDTNDFGDVFVAQTQTRIAPYNVVATPLTPSGVQLTWVDGFSNETSFRIERSFGNNLWTEIVTVGANQTTYTDPSTLCGRLYTYRIRATLPNNLTSSYSLNASVITATCIPSCSANAYPQRVSVGLNGVQANASSNYVSMSADGRYIGFVSSASNLGGGDTNTSPDVFVLDRQTSQIRRVSVASDGTQANSASYQVSISATGRYIAFISEATNLVPGDTNGISDIFVHDLQTHQTTRVSVTSGGVQATGSGSYYLPPNALSDDGRYVAFSSYNATLSVEDNNGNTDVFIHDRQTVQTLRVSRGIGGVDANGYSYALDISGDGRYLIMMSGASNLIADDTNGRSDLFLHDLQTSQTTRFNISSDGVEANGSSQGYAQMAANQRYLFFDSVASNLVSNDTNGYSDLMVRDLQTSQTARILLAPNGQQPNGNSTFVDVSADGNYVLFVSSASNLVSGDTNDLADLMVLNRLTGSITRVSIGCDGGQSNSNLTAQGVLSNNGQVIAFPSTANNLVANDTNAASDIFVFFRTAVNTVDALAVFNSATHNGNRIQTLESNPAPYDYNYSVTGFPNGAGGQYVMGDWDGNGTDTVGVYRNGAFIFTNDNGTATHWDGIWFGLGGQAVAGRFDANVGHDCIGVTDSGTWTNGDTYFAFYFTCNLTSGPTPPLTFQWLSIVLPTSVGFTGTHQFGAGDFDGDGVDSIAIRRGAFIAWTNVPPTTLLSEFSLAQYVGIPGTGDEGQLVVGDWDFNHLDSFGLVYQNGWFYRRDDLQWNSGLYSSQQFTPMVNTPFWAATWRPN